VRGEQPAREPLFGIVQAIAGSELGEDHAAPLGAFHQELTQRLGALHFLLEFRKGHAEGLDLHLDHAARGARGLTPEQVVAGDDAFAAGHADFRAATIGHRDHFGGDAGGDEEGVAGDLFGVVEDSPCGKRDVLEPGTKGTSIRLRKSVQKKIVDTLAHYAPLCFRSKDNMRRIPAKKSLSLKKAWGLSICGLYVTAAGFLCSLSDRYVRY
jgi:hypothetical protein